MHSHMYFYAADARPDWNKPASSDQDSRDRIRMITNALVTTVPSLREHVTEGCAAIGTWLYLSPLDQLYVHADHVHWDIKYRSGSELAEYATMPTLRAVSTTLERVAGFDFFENGCQGLEQRGDIEEMPAVLAGEYEWRYLDNLPLHRTAKRNRATGRAFA